MKRDAAEVVIKVYAILAWVSAAFAVLGALGMLWMSLMGGVMGGFSGDMGIGLMGGTFASLGIIAAVVLVLLAVFYAITGLGLWRHREWSRIAVIVFSCLSLFNFPLGTIIGCFGIYFFGFEETTKSMFKGKVSLDEVRKTASEAKETAKKATKKTARKATKRKK